MNIKYLISKFINYLQIPSLNNCKIDKDSKIGPGCNCINMKIGKYSYIGRYNTIIDTSIGNFCSIASYCSIGGVSHNLKFISTSPIFYKNNIFKVELGNLNMEKSKGVIIGNDVWIGEKVFIKDGVKINDGAIIGANSVVTHEVPAFSIYGGVPAKFIRFRFNESEIKKIKALAWWSWDDDKLKSFDFNKFIEELENK